MQIARSHERKLLPVVDLFAGPGGLGEGFSALEHDRVRFDVVLSVEKDPAAHRTLRLFSLRVSPRQQPETGSARISPTANKGGLETAP